MARPAATGCVPENASRAASKRSACACAYQSSALDHHHHLQFLFSAGARARSLALNSSAASKFRPTSDYSGRRASMEMSPRAPRCTCRVGLVGLAAAAAEKRIQAQSEARAAEAKKGRINQWQEFPAKSARANNCLSCSAEPRRSDSSWPRGAARRTLNFQSDAFGRRRNNNSANNNNARSQCEKSNKIRLGLSVRPFLSRLDLASLESARAADPAGIGAHYCCCRRRPLQQLNK